MMNSPQAFDSLATSYDDTFSNTQIGRYLRGKVQARLSQHFHAGQHVLELGCGTGEDALFLAERGVHVTATDASEAMLDVVRKKAGGNPLVQVKQLDINSLSNTDLNETGTFDGVFSNFGALNCVQEWHPLAIWLAQIIKPGAKACFGIMSPLCLWEPLWHGLHLDFQTATRRWRRSTSFQPTDDIPAISVSYPTIRRITLDFIPYFRRVHVVGIGLFLPPSDVFGVIEKRPRLLKILLNLEQRFGQCSKLALFADHYWIEFERTEV